jgi:hypothetical protein
MIRQLLRLLVLRVNVWCLEHRPPLDPNPEYSDWDRRDGLGS